MFCNRCTQLFVCLIITCLSVPIDVFGTRPEITQWPEVSRGILEPDKGGIFGGYRTEIGPAI